jgi:hypothetical protein
MRGRSTRTASFAVVLLVVGQLAALAHAATTRHVTCQEHGEELEAPTLAQALDTCEQDHFIAVDDVGGDHEDCAVVHLLKSGSVAPEGVHAVASTLGFTEAIAPPAVTDPRVSKLLLIAPKTSPPTL